MKVTPAFEENAAGNLKKEVWEAPDAEIDKILQEYIVPSPGEMDRPGSYVQTTLPEMQQKRVEKNDVVLIPHRLDRASRIPQRLRPGYSAGNQNL